MSKWRQWRTHRHLFQLSHVGFLSEELSVGIQFSFSSTRRYRAFPERRRSKASFIFDIGNVSVIGAMEWRAQNSSMSSIAVGLPVGDPETDFWPRIRLKAGTCSGLRTAPTLCRQPFGASVSRRPGTSNPAFTVEMIRSRLPAIFFSAPSCFVLWT